MASHSKRSIAMETSQHDTAQNVVVGYDQYVGGI